MSSARGILERAALPFLRAAASIRRRHDARRFDYPYSNLLAIGLPKSGTTWMLRMLSAVPGYIIWKTPDQVRNEHGIIRRRDFVPGPSGYTATKLHAWPTDEHLDVLEEAGRPYVAMIRDLRDVSVSWAHFVALPGRTDWSHPEAVDLPLEGRISYYIEHILDKRLDWSLQWRERLHPALGLLVRYEQMKEQPVEVMEQVCAHYRLGLPDDAVRGIVEQHAFRRATGREPGQEDRGSFNRKGIVGDWINHYTDAHKDAFRRVSGGRLAALGYVESEDAW
ncbi:MAG: sulfotransferase domain-containing protein [Planctomycetota bacterium]